MTRRLLGTSLIFFLSGSAAIGYEIVWTRLFAIGIGHELPSVMAVLVAYFGGFSLGAWSLDRAISRSDTPGRWYAWLEGVIGLWGLASTVLIPWASSGMARILGLSPAPLWYWSVSLLVPFLVLLPATTAMGATFVAMDRLLAREWTNGRVVAAVYALNTLGAMIGVLGTTFVFAPAFGFTTTIVGLALLNLLCAIAAFFWLARKERCGRDVVKDAPTTSPAHARVGLTIAGTGLLGIGFEILGIRVLSQVLENTVYTFAGALFVFLGATALGASLYQRFGKRLTFDGGCNILLGLAGWTCALATVVLAFSRPLLQWLGESIATRPLGLALPELLIAAAVFGLPAMVMGGLFSHLAQASRHRSGGVGRALALNTLGGSLAGVVFGIILLPFIGPRWTLSLIALGYLALVPRMRISGKVFLGLTVPLALFPFDLHLIRPADSEGHVVVHREGVSATAAVVTSGSGDVFLKVNDLHLMGGTRSAFAEKRQGHLPLLLHQDPRNALFLGIGTGITLGVATTYPHLKVTGVELLPEVEELFSHFAPMNAFPWNPSQIEVVVADARRFVRATNETYDVIVADLFHPARDGAGMLYTVEHFEAIGGKLRKGGLFCQWLPLHQLDQPTLKLILRSYLSVFPKARGFLAHYNAITPVLGLFASNDGELTWATDWFAQRLNRGKAPPPLELERLALGNQESLFGGYLGAADSLHIFAGKGPLNCDDRPLVVYQAPRFGFGSLTPYGRLESLLDSVQPRLADFWSPSEAPPSMGDYFNARNLYLESRILELQGDFSSELSTLLDSVHASDSFQTSYVTLLIYAQRRFQQNPDLWEEVLVRLSELRPTEPAPRDLLNRLRESQ